MTPRRDLELKENWNLIARISQSVIILRSRPPDHIKEELILLQQERDFSI
jgi:hypothetical protein